ncbi:MAG: hypothetical protein ACREGE_00820 [Candidatus Microsaccharimonas sp.]
MSRYPKSHETYLSTPSPKSAESALRTLEQPEFVVTEILEQSSQLPKGEPYGYGATPLDRMATLGSQRELALTLQGYTLSIPEDVPLSVADYVHRTFMERFYGRAEANEENYTTSLRTKEDYADNEAIQAMIERGELGHASPTELLILRDLLGIRSVELACVTHPYGERIEMLQEMREVVAQHVIQYGGRYDPDPSTRFRVKEVIGRAEGDTSLTNGLLMTRKRTLATLPDGTTIRERSSFVLRTDEQSLLNKEDIAALKTVDLSQPDCQDKLVEAAHLDEMARILLKSDFFSQAIPISTTIYAFNEATANEIHERDHAQLLERRAEFAKQYPVLAAAAQNYNTPSAEVFNDLEGSGMLYVGPKITD